MSYLVTPMTLHSLARSTASGVLLVLGVNADASQASPAELREAAVLEAGTLEAGTLEEVVVTALPLRSSPLETAQPVSVLAGEALLRRRDGSLGETLAQTPGVTASAFGPLASRPVLRGQGGLRVQTYQDSADTLDVAALSDDHAVTLDPLVARSIEVLRGPAALMFGNSAAAGAVNVVTARLPMEKLPNPLAGSVELRGNAPHDDARAAAAFGWKIDEAWQLTADAFRARSEDLAIPGYAWSATLREAKRLEGEPVDETRDRLPNSAGASDGANLGLGWIGEQAAIAAAISRHDMNYGLPGPGEEEGEPSDIRLDLRQQRGDIAAQWRFVDGPFDLLRLRGSRNDYQHVELEGDEIGTRYGQKGDEWRVTLERGEQSAASRGVIGLQWRHLEFDAEGEEAFLPPTDTRNLGGFFFEEFAIGRIVLEAGARLERQRISLLGVSEQAAGYDDTALNGSVAMRWQLSESVAWTAQVNSSERHPTATELYAQGPHLAVRRFELGDEALGKEKGLGVDLAVKWSIGAWRAEVSAFATDYDDYIVASPTADEEDGLPVVRFAAGEASFRGGEMTLSNPNLLELGRGQLGVEVFGDYVRARDDTGAPLPQIPPLRLGGSMGWDDGVWRVALESVWHDTQSRVAANESATEGYTLLGVDLSWRRRTAETTAVWFLRGSNLLDAEARRHVSPLKDFAPLRARSVSAGVRFDF